MPLFARLGASRLHGRAHEGKEPKRYELCNPPTIRILGGFGKLRRYMAFERHGCSLHSDEEIVRTRREHRRERREDLVHRPLEEEFRAGRDAAHHDATPEQDVDAAAEAA